MKKIVTFVILVFALSAPFNFLLIKSHTLSFHVNPFLTMFGLMWCPAISAFITAFIFRIKIRNFGWKLGQIRWLLLAYGLPIVYASLAYGFILYFGFGEINPAYHTNFVKLVILGTLFNMAFVLGEETGWRGFLVPQLYQRFSYTKTSFITGIIWALWHFPIIIYGVYLTGMPLSFQLPLFVITVMAMTFPINWLRLRSGSLWTAVLLHSSHNLYIQRFFDPITLNTNAWSSYLRGESGIAMAVLFILLAIIFWKFRDKLKPAN